ncbi:MAG TPA: NADP-dependent phosphogluconate dehydrogenase [Candidatus Saccharimonadaceae bacterium]|nr:NADP-dependent phosphogluconate dehydrogenase [Candidatus Saccharimonadaceae bacterium]
MKLAVVGLGKMGAQIAQMLIGAGHQVVAVDPNPEAVKTAEGFGAIPATTRVDAVSKFTDGEHPVIWLMIPAKFVTDEVAGWREVLPADSIVIDGGNTDFRETKGHAASLAEKGIKFVDVGTSGGILGLKNGFSMMAGGDEDAYHTISPILDVLAGTRGGHDFFGEPGAGHYVKMVHNAIEYGMMESLAEGYRMLREGAYAGLDLAKAGDVWQKASVIESTLNALAAEVMHEDQNLASADGYVAESGEGRWTLEVAKQKNIALPAIQTAFDVRLASQNGDTNYSTKLLAELRNKFGGHPLNTNG